MALQEWHVLPLRKLRQFLQCLADGLGEKLGRKALCQRIDRLDERHAVERGGRHDVVRVGHLRFVVEPVDLARDEACFALGQHAPDRVRIGVEKHQREGAGAVGDIDPVGDLPVAGWRRAVAHDGGFHRHHAFGRQIADLRAEAPVHDTGGQVKQQVNDARRIAGCSVRRAQEGGQQPVQLGADALQAGGPGEQWIEERWTHGPISPGTGCGARALRA